MGWFKSFLPEKHAVKICINPELLERQRELEIERDTQVVDTLIHGRQMRQQMVREILSSKANGRNE